MLKILITGATGFVGRRLVPALTSMGYHVRCAVTKKVDWLSAEQVVVARLENDPNWDEALSDVDVVIHLAARVHVMREKSRSVLDDYCKINSVATRDLAVLAAKHQVKRFIYLSSIKVNGEVTVTGHPFTEESSAQPEDPYGQSKLYAEHYLHEVSQNTGLQVVILRPPLVYGPEVRANFLKMLHLVKKSIPLPFAKVQNYRHMIYVDNLVSALCAVVTHTEAANQTYLVADDESLSLTQLLSIIAGEMNVNLKLLPIPVQLMGGLLRFIGLKNLTTRLFGSLEVDNSKIKSQLGWVPPIRCMEGIKETVKWYQRESNS